MRNAIRDRLRLATALALPSLARAQDFPRQQIRLILPFAPGTGSDAIARHRGA